MLALLHVHISVAPLPPTLIEYLKAANEHETHMNVTTTLCLVLCLSLCLRLSLEKARRSFPELDDG